MHLLDSRTLSRTLGAVGLVLGPLVWLASSALSPAWADESSEYLAEIAGNTTRHVLSGTLFLVGALILLPGLLATARLLRGRRIGVGQIGAYALGIGGVVAGTLIFTIAAIEAAMVDESANRGEMVALAERSEDSTAAIFAFLGTFVVGFVGGMVLLAIGLWTRRVVPLWSPLLLVGAVVAMFVLGESALGSVVGMAILAAGFAPISYRLLTLTDEEWERWGVLPERPRSRPRAENARASAT